MAVADADAAAPFGRTAAVDPHNSEELLSIPRQAVLFIENPPAARVHHITDRIDHLHVRHRFPTDRPDRSRHLRNLITPDKTGIALNHQSHSYLHFFKCHCLQRCQ